MQNRREFIKGSSVFATMMAAAPIITGCATSKGIAKTPGAPRIFKVGMIGAGGRCKGAFGDLTKAAAAIGHGIELVAVCDFFEEKAKAASKQFSGEKAKAFGGANGYKEVVAIPEIEIIITATPPAFRPIHVEAAIKAGKHVFAEKPVAVDGPGFASLLPLPSLLRRKSCRWWPARSAVTRAGTICRPRRCRKASSAKFSAATSIGTGRFRG